MDINSILYWIALILVIIGAVAWGVYGVTDKKLNIVYRASQFLPQSALVEKATYLLVGASGLAALGLAIAHNVKK